MKKVLKIFWDILFPIECLGCGCDSYWLCNACQEKLQYNESFFQKDSALEYLDGVFVIFQYDRLSAKLIKTFKYNGAIDIGNMLANLAFDFLKNKDINLQENKLLYVPLSPFKKRWRGFNQSEIVANILATKLARPLILGLTRVKNRTPQAQLKREDRLKNLKDCFIWTGPALQGEKILLIDDVATTGTTLNECAKVLKKAGAQRVLALVLARGK